MKQCDKIHSDSLCIISYFRYAVGRSSYVVPACVEFLKYNWNKLSENERFVILRDLEDWLFRQNEDSWEKKEWETLFKEKLCAKD